MTQFFKAIPCIAARRSLYGIALSRKQKIGTGIFACADFLN